MGDKMSRKSRATSGCNEASPCHDRDHSELAETCAGEAERFQKKKKTTKVAGGTMSGVAIGAGLAAGGAGGVLAVGTLISVAAGIPTLGAGFVVGMAITTSVAVGTGVAGLAGVAAGVTGGVITHLVAEEFQEAESSFRKIGKGLIKQPQPLLMPNAEQTLPCTSTLLDVSSTPKLHNVLELVVPSVASKWRFVATHLKVEPCVIDIISNNHPKDCEGACWDMLKRWLGKERNTGEEKRTWSTLLTALGKAGFDGLKERLRREHFKQSSPITR